VGVITSKSWSVFLRLRCGVAPERVGRPLEFSQEMLLEYVTGEEQVGAIRCIRGLVMLVSVIPNDALKLLVAGHQTVFRTKDPQLVQEGAMHLLLGRTTSTRYKGEVIES
jgi:hypothetical protein